MAGTSILREFLVAIGFKVDEEQLAKADSKLAAVENTLATMAKTAVATGFAVSAGVLKITDSMERLYFASQRTGASIEGIKAFGFAASQIGISFDEAEASLESLAHTLRNNPAMTGRLQAMGINPNQDRAKVETDLLDKLTAPNMPTYIGNQLGAQFGISENILTMYRANAGEFKRNFAAQQAMVTRGGADYSKAGIDAHRAQSAIRTTAAQSDVIAQIATDKLSGNIITLTDAMNRLTGAVLDQSKTTNGKAAVGAFATTSLAGVIGTASITSTILSALGLGGAAAAGGSALALGGAGLAVGGAGYEAYKHQDDIRKYLHDRFGINFSGNGFEQRDSSGVAGHNPGNLRPFAAGQATFTRKGTGVFRSFDSDEQGLSEMARQLLLDFKRGRDTVAAEIDKYDHGNTSYANTVAKRMGVGTNEKLNLSDPSTLVAMMKAMIHVEQGRDPYSDSTIAGAVNARLGKSGAAGGNTLNVHTEIQVNGSSDAAATGRAVATEQKQVVRDITQNGIGAAQ